MQVRGKKNEVTPREKSFRKRLFRDEEQQQRLNYPSALLSVASPAVMTLQDGYF
jgi:hypothetical protein